MDSTLLKDNKLSDLPAAPLGKKGWPWTVSEDAADFNDQNTEIIWPKISIVTPNYNYGQFLEETIRSVLMQKYPNLEYIIIDDGSTDNSSEIIMRYEPWLAYWKTGPNRGQTQVLNEGMHRATGEIMTWLNSDDLLRKGSLMAIGDFFRKRKESQVVFGDCMEINETSQPRGFFHGRPFTRAELIRRWDKVYHDFWIIQPSVFFKRSLLDEFGYLNEGNQSCMDYEFWLKINSKYTFQYLNCTLSATRNHDSSRSVKFRSQQFQDSIAVSRKYWHENILKYYLSYYFFAKIKYPLWESVVRRSADLTKRTRRPKN
jgi:glycosyltransferase involved in cell wall biosynthesis